jgi:hypothetical protein
LRYVAIVVLFRVDARTEATDALLGFEWIEVLAIEPAALAFRTRDFGEWCDRRIIVDYICLTPGGLLRIRSDDFWAALEEYGEYDQLTPQQHETGGIVITTGDASVVQTGGVLAGGVHTSRDSYSAERVGSQGPHGEGRLVESSALPNLVSELQQLREALLQDATEADDFVVVGAVAEAETAGTKDDEGRLRASLNRAGRKALTMSEQLGLGVASSAIAAAIGIAG